MFTLHTIKLINGSTNPAIKCVRGHTLNINAQEEAMQTAGSDFARFVSILSQDSTINFESYAIDQVLTLTGLRGGKIKTGQTYTSLELYFARYDEFGQLVSGSNHIKFVVNFALLSWSTVACQTNQDATIAGIVSILNPGGGTLPVVVTTGVALPTAAADDTRFTLGSATLATKSVGCLQSLQINSNQTLSYRRCSSNVYPEGIQSNNIKPTIQLTAQQVDLFSSGQVPFTGLPLAHADTKIFLRKRLNNQVGFVDDATTEHIKLTCAGIARVTTHSSTVPDPGVTTVSITTIDDATNAPLVLLTGQAIA